MSNEISLFAADNSIVSFEDKKGNVHSMTTEGALFKGGAALKSLKDVAMQSAAAKAINGKYRSASDILAAAFPSTAKAFDKICGTPWANKSSMSSFLIAMERAEGGKNGFSAKQVQARMFMQALRQIPSLAKSDDEAFTINAA